MTEKPDIESAQEFARQLVNTMPPLLRKTLFDEEFVKTLMERAYMEGAVQMGHWCTSKLKI